MAESAGEPRTQGDGPRQVHPMVVLLAGYGWRLLVLGAVVVATYWVLAELWVLVLTVVVALYLARALDLPMRWLRARGLPPAAAALSCLALLFAAVGLVGWLVVPRMADEFSELGPTLSQATDDVERWLVDDAPFDVSEQDIADLRERMGQAVDQSTETSGGSLVSGAVAVVEVLTGLILAVVTAFFILKDGPRFQSWCTERFPTHRRPTVRRMGAKAWTTLGGYLRGVALLGTFEGIVLAITITVVGGSLALPVAIVTFLASFVPIVGAVVAGVMAVLVALATAGVAPAVIVAVVAIVVQQLDNDLLSPVVYGHTLELHPLVVLFAIVAGGALFGIAGTVLAVPLTAIAVAVLAEARADDGAEEGATEGSGDLAGG